MMQECRSDGDRRGCLDVRLMKEGGRARHSEEVVTKEKGGDDIYTGRKSGGA